jgi:hypothetical protein
MDGRAGLVSIKVTCGFNFFIRKRKRVAPFFFFFFLLVFLLTVAWNLSLALVLQGSPRRISGKA